MEEERKIGTIGGNDIIEPLRQPRVEKKSSSGDPLKMLEFEQWLGLQKQETKEKKSCLLCRNDILHGEDFLRVCPLKREEEDSMNKGGRVVTCYFCDNCAPVIRDAVYNDTYNGCGCEGDIKDEDCQDDRCGRPYECGGSNCHVSGYCTDERCRFFYNKY